MWETVWNCEIYVFLGTSKNLSDRCRRDFKHKHSSWGSKVGSRRQTRTIGDPSHLPCFRAPAKFCHLSVVSFIRGGECRNVPSPNSSDHLQPSEGGVSIRQLLVRHNTTIRQNGTLSPPDPVAMVVCHKDCGKISSVAKIKVLSAGPSNGYDEHPSSWKICESLSGIK
jgi:hypothetical protein